MNPPKSLNFENTEKAFAHLDSKQLKKALFLFQTVGNVRLVKVGKVLVHLALKLRIPIGWAIRPTVYSHFCGGESIGECHETIETLDSLGVQTILDFSSEGKESEPELQATFEEIQAAILATKDDQRHAFSVFKVSGIAPTALLEKASRDFEAMTPVEKDAWKRVNERVNALCECAVECKTPLFIDAEESWLQPAIDRLALEAMKKFNQGENCWIYNTVQLYRVDRLSYLKSITTEGNQQGFQVGVKLVRGAYMEKERNRAIELGYPSPIHPNKQATDEAFNAGIHWCLDHLDRIAFCAGTHNEESSALLAQLILEKGIDPGDNRIWFAQLLGMSDHISFNLSDAGFSVAKYVPFGPIQETIPYLIRRAEENTSVAGQSSRELELIRREVSRRKSVV